MHTLVLLFEAPSFTNSKDMIGAKFLNKKLCYRRDMRDVLHQLKY